MPWWSPLQNEIAQVFVVRDAFESLIDIIAIDGNASAFHFRRFKADFFKQPFHDGIEAASPDVLSGLIDFISVACQRLDRVVRKRE